MGHDHNYSGPLPPFTFYGSRLEKRTMEECLNSLRRQELDEIRSNYGIEKISNLKKPEMVNLLERHITENIEEIAAYIPRNMYLSLVKLARNGVTLIEQWDVLSESVDSLRKIGLLFSVWERTGECELLIPGSIKRAVLSLPSDESFMARRDLSDRIDKTILCIFYYWGIVGRQDLLKETARLLEMPLDDSFIKHFDNVFKYMDDFYSNSERIDGSTYYHMFSNQAEQQISSSIWQDSSYPEITGDMLNPEEGGWIGIVLHSPYFKCMYESLINSGKNIKEDWEEFAYEAVSSIAELILNQEPGTNAEQLGRSFGVLNELKKAPVVKELLNDLLLYTPNYWLKGNSVSGEIHVITRQQPGKPSESCDTDVSPAKGKKSAVEIAASSWKVGRNDLCPCGSGKKYKDCCIRN